MKYIYPDSEHWLHYLEPVEIAYVILFAYCTKNFREKIALIEVERNRDGYVIDDEEHGDNDYELHAIPDGESDYDDYKYGLYIEFSFAATHTEGDSGDWNNPPEAGESILDDITVTDINITIDGGDNYTSITSRTIPLQTDTFTYKDLNDLAEEASSELLEGVTVNPYSRLKRTFPPKLDEKIKGILKDNEIRIQNASLGKKYGI